MPPKKSKGSILQAINSKKRSAEEDVQPVLTKSKKRKSAQNRTGGETGKFVSVHNVTKKAGVNPSPANKNKKGKKFRNSTFAAPVKGKVSSEDNKTGQTDADDHCKESGETEENPPPKKEARKSKKSPQSKKFKKAISVPRARYSTGVDSGKNERQFNLPPRNQEQMAERGASYLILWEKDRFQWRFKTRIQKWLVHNMMNDSLVPEEIFPIFLKHISGANGQVLKLVHQLATDVVKKAEKKKADLDDPKFARARSILKNVEFDK